MNDVITFTIPHRLVRLNEYINAERSNKYFAAKIKKEMTNLCSYYIPNIKVDKPVEIKMIWTVKNFGNDPDNVSMGAKFVLDAMVERGMLPKDNLTMIKKLTHEFRRGEQEQVEVRVSRYIDWRQGGEKNENLISRRCGHK